MLFRSNDTATTEIYTRKDTLSLHDALPISDGWKLCLRDMDLNELYNLKDDPFETRNLYSDVQYASVVSRLSGEIYRWQETTNDELKF